MSPKELYLLGGPEIYLCSGSSGGLGKPAHRPHKVVSLFSTVWKTETRQQEACGKGQGDEGLLEITAFTTSTLEMSGFSAATQGEGFIHLL